MTWLYVTFPLMVLAAAIATLPLVHLIVREERSHRTVDPDAVPAGTISTAYSTRPGPVRTGRLAPSERMAA